jgi:hypothetical protein
MNLSKRTELRRIPERGSHDRKTIDSILDAGFLAHVGFCLDGQPFVIPTLYGRDGERLYLHGSAASRMLRELETRIAACVTVTLSTDCPGRLSAGQTVSRRKARVDYLVRLRSSQITASICTGTIRETTNGKRDSLLGRAHGEAAACPKPQHSYEKVFRC